MTVILLPLYIQTIGRLRTLRIRDDNSSQTIYFERLMTIFLSNLQLIYVAVVDLDGLFWDRSPLV